MSDRPVAEVLDRVAAVLSRLPDRIAEAMEGRARGRPALDRARGGPSDESLRVSGDAVPAPKRQQHEGYGETVALLRKLPLVGGFFGEVGRRLEQMQAVAEVWKRTFGATAYQLPADVPKTPPVVSRARWSGKPSPGYLREAQKREAEGQAKRRAASDYANYRAGRVALGKTAEKAGAQEIGARRKEAAEKAAAAEAQRRARAREGADRERRQQESLRADRAGIAQKPARVTDRSSVRVGFLGRMRRYGQSVARRDKGDEAGRLKRIAEAQAREQGQAKEIRDRRERILEAQARERQGADAVRDRRKAIQAAQEQEKRQARAIGENRRNREARQAAGQQLPQPNPQRRTVPSKSPVDDFTERRGNLKRMRGHGRRLEKQSGTEDQKRAGRDEERVDAARQAEQTRHLERAARPGAPNSKQTQRQRAPDRKRAEAAQRRARPAAPDLPLAGLVDFGKPRSRNRNLPGGFAPELPSPDVPGVEARTRKRTAAARPGLLGRRQDKEGKAGAALPLSPVPKRSDPGQSMPASRTPRVATVGAEAAVPGKRRRVRQDETAGVAALKGARRQRSRDVPPAVSEAGRTLALWGWQKRRDAGQAGGTGSGRKWVGREEAREEELAEAGGRGGRGAASGGGELLVVMRELVEAVEELTKRMDRGGKTRQEAEGGKGARPGPGGQNLLPAGKELAKAFDPSRRAGGTGPSAKDIGKVLDGIGRVAEVL